MSDETKESALWSSEAPSGSLKAYGELCRLAADELERLELLQEREVWFLRCEAHRSAAEAAEKGAKTAEAELERVTKERDALALRLVSLQESYGDACRHYDSAWQELTLAVRFLNQIASWREGDIVTGSFDEPDAARTARKVLFYLPSCGITPHIPLPQNERDDSLMHPELVVEGQEPDRSITEGPKCPDCSPLHSVHVLDCRYSAVQEQKP